MKLHTTKKVTNKETGEVEEQDIATEDLECLHFVRWLKEMKEDGLIERFAHIPNETRTTSRFQKIRIKMLGGDRGLPDYVVVIPSLNHTGNEGMQVWVEMKRSDGGSVSKHQREWMASLNALPNVIAGSFSGAKPACEFVSQYCKQRIDPASVF